MARPAPIDSPPRHGRPARSSRSLVRALVPLSGIAVLILVWDVALSLGGGRSQLLPRPFAVVRGSARLSEGEIGSRKGRTLLKLLAVHRRSAVPVDLIVDTLWSDEPPAKAC